MATKKLKALSDTAQTLYCVIQRQVDDFFLNDADGTFATAPADFYLSLTEHSTVKGLYSVSESRTTWDDGTYTMMVYSQSGGSPAIASDFPLGSISIQIATDIILFQTGDSFARIGSTGSGLTSLATPTNITAGTITTVTNLTNAPTNGDLTATMKASINTEADTALTDYGALKPTVSGRTLDVTTTGGAGIDWSNVENPTTTLNLSATTIKTATDVETDTVDIQSRLPAALVSGRIDSSVGAMATDTITADALAASAVSEITTAILASGDIDGYTLEGSQKVILASASGKLSGAATSTLIIRAADDSRARITATVDADGNRSAVTIDATG